MFWEGRRKKLKDSKGTHGSAADGFLSSVAKLRRRRAKLSLFVILAATVKNCAAGVYSMFPVVASCPLRRACLTSIPAIVQRAAQNGLNPSLGSVRRFTARWSFSMKGRTAIPWTFLHDGYPSTPLTGRAARRSPHQRCLLQRCLRVGETLAC